MIEKCKKGFMHKIWCLVFIGVLCGIFVAWNVMDEGNVSNIYAAQDEADENATTENIHDMVNELNDVRSSKDSAEELLKDLQIYKDDAVRYIDELDGKLLELDDDLVYMKGQQAGIQDNLDMVQQELDKELRQEGQQYAAMKLRIKYLYEHGNYTFMDALAGSTSLGDMLNRTSLASMIQEYDADLLEKYRASLNAIAEKEAVISEKQQELAQVTIDLQTEKDSVNALIRDKSKQLKHYNKNISAAGNLIKSYEKAEEECEAAIAAAESSALSYDDEMYAALPSEYTGGKFLWPAPGHYTITSPFGYRVHPLTGSRRLHAGIDIAVPSGSGIYAGEDGVVSISTYSSSAGNYILINHGGGLSTVYMHNSKLLVDVGDTVKKGQKIALSGSTGWSTGPHCHFGVRVNGRYVNPIPYLKSTKSSNDSDYSDDSNTPDITDDDINNNPEKDNSDSSTPTTEVVDEDTSQYTTEADDAGDKEEKSSDLKDDSDPDSE